MMLVHRYRLEEGEIVTFDAESMVPDSSSRLMDCNVSSTVKRFDGLIQSVIVPR